MTADHANLGALACRDGFNLAVRHIKRTIALMEESGTNLADLLFEMDDEEFSGAKAGLILNLLLADKRKYKTVSANLRSTALSPPALSKEFAKWKGVDLVVSYHHPELGLLMANPKNADELAVFGDLRKNELIVVYAGKGENPADEHCAKAAELAVCLFEGGKVKVPAAILKGSFTVKRLTKPGPAPKTETPQKKTAKISAQVRESPLAALSPEPVQMMTPRYAVVVQNELFHNGNVEAWKRIIASYNAKYPQLRVFIYYEGEHIHDINALFKWGKVKHGSAIEFAVAGGGIRDVAKLQRYLAQGASSRFEVFLQGSITAVLKLF